MTNTTKTRDSNMELLRITAMLMVMIVHASYRALPKPTPDSIAADELSAFLQYVAEGFSVMAVDVFVMLSGWYGIRLRWSRLAELLFQVVFFGILCAALSYALTGEMPHHMVKTVLLLGEGDYWFVKTYVALYLLSPVLNAFVERATRRQMETTLLALFLFQWVFGWVFEATTWLRAGYSLPSFMALYLLARYLHVFNPRFAQWPKRVDLAVYVLTCSAVAVAAFFLKKHFDVGGVLFFYNSPTTILSATAFLLFFSKCRLRSRLVNWVAVSALAIYLTHSNSFVGQYYDMYIRQWHAAESRPVFLLYVVLLIAAVFVGSILIDKVRMAVYKVFLRCFQSRRAPVR